MVTRRLIPGMSVLAATLVALMACSAPSPSTTSPPAPAGKAPEGPQAKWEQTLQAARKEGSVVVVTHTNLLYRETLQRFREKYPDIAVEHVAIRPSEFAPKVVAEQQNGQFGYDLWVSSTSNMVEVVVPTGGFENITPYLIHPDVTEGKNWRGGKLIYATAEPLIVLNRGNVSGDFYVNRDILPKEQLNHVDQLQEPRFKGQIMIRTPNAPHGASLLMTGWLHSKGEEYVWRVMKDQEPVYIENARLLTQNLINGKYSIAIGQDGATIDNCKQAGGCANLDRIRGYEHMLGHGAGVLKRPPHPAAAAVFLNWYLSKDGQEAFMKGIVDTEPEKDSAHSIRVDVEPHPEALALQTVPDYTNLSKYSLQGMEQGAAEMQTIIDLYRKVEAGLPR